MRLTKVHVTEFRSIRDSDPFDVGDITCLVGKNEAGKTALLQAIYRVKPIVAADAGYSVTDDYPRRDVADYEHSVSEEDSEHATVTELKYELDDSDLAAISAVFGRGAVTSNVLTVSKSYEQAGHTYGLSVNTKAALAHLIKPCSLPNELKTSLLTCDTAISVQETLAGTEETEAVKRVSQWMAAIVAQGSLGNYIFTKILYSRIPSFMYFDEYYQMRGCDNIEALQQRVSEERLEPPDYPLLGLVNQARLDLDGLLNPTRTRDLKNSLEGAGNHLTKSIVKYWSQNQHLQMRFDVRPARPEDPERMRTGTNLWAEVYDTRHMVTTELGSRSRGFVWFFSFLAWYGDVQRERKNVILLLDEPGLSLHGKAQGDLLQYFEEQLAPNHQVIYTTHSPFMVDPSKFDRVRIVQDRSLDSTNPLPPEEEGTKVTQDVLEATDDSLFPLQGALGYELTQTLFVGPNSLVVEGVSDLLFLQVMGAVLQNDGREGLHINWTITPVGGSDKVPTFVALLGAQHYLNIVTLIDFQQKDRQSIENMWGRKLLKKKNVLTFADFVGTKEADIEDMFDDGFYLELVNQEFKSAIKKQILVKALPKGGRIVTRIQKHIDQYPLRNNESFNHYRPARYLSEHVTELRGKMSDAMLDRFEHMFMAVNKLLRSSSSRART